LGEPELYPFAVLNGTQSSGSRFWQIGDGDGDGLPIPGKSGMGPPSPMGMGIGGSVPCPGSPFFLLLLIYQVKQCLMSSQAPIRPDEANDNSNGATHRRFFVVVCLLVRWSSTLSGHPLPEYSRVQCNFSGPPRVSRMLCNSMHFSLIKQLRGQLRIVS
jgi:hypothetical protein